VRRCRDASVEAYAHQEVPFEVLVRRLVRRRDTSHPPLIQVKMYARNLEFPELQVGDLTFQAIDALPDRVQNDLLLAIDDQADGIHTVFEYNVDLFERETVERKLRLFEGLIDAVVEDPDASITALRQRLDSIETALLRDRARERSSASANLFRRGRSRESRPSDAPLVRAEPLQPGSSLPLVLSSGKAGVDLAAWIRSNRPFVDERLHHHGGLLFRGFGPVDPRSFERLATAAIDELSDENGEHPREVVSGRVYTPVRYSSKRKIYWHNENSFNRRWPRKIIFGCVKPSETGGETPIADSRVVYERLPSDFRDRCVEEGLIYIRRYGSGFGRGWQDVFGTSNRREVEDRCREDGIEFRWENDEMMTTRVRRPAVISDARTGCTSWVAQIAHFHPRCLGEKTRASVLESLGSGGLPRNVFYGSGDPICDSDVDAMLEVYESLEVTTRWRIGDVLLVDNISAAHARNPYSGDRRILVAMGDSVDFEDAETQ